ncbi:unnamed protein product [Protopolystoma xenopodis]|uniref:Uncharacterized protein n=1 Tax=Protopolystoma xenopodis TaxID=117903 RepID=A0A448WVS1_9PLAT|nr:unnamed protein product [Protopolystoma xenopodis]
MGNRRTCANLLSNPWEGVDLNHEHLTDALVRKAISHFLRSQKAFRFNNTAEELYMRYTWWPNLTNETARRERLIAVSDKLELIILGTYRSLILTGSHEREMGLQKQHSIF